MKRTILKIGAPLVAILTLMIGLRIGAGEAVRAAVVFGAPLPHPSPNGSTRLVWQLLTFLDDRGVKETIPMKGIEVVARSKGHEARWQGASNADGIAEVSLEMEGLAYGDALDLEVRIADEKAPLAAGAVKWGPPREERSIATTNAATARPTVRNGIVGLDVVVEGGRLIAGFPTPVWVRATTRAGMAPNSLVIDADPEPGLLVDREREKATPCASGWAEFPMTAQAHVTGSGFTARRLEAGQAGAEGDAGIADAGAADADADAGSHAGKHPAGRWFGALPVAAGAFFISMPRAIEANKPNAAVLIAPNPRDVVYAELDDTRGRVAAAALTVAIEAGDPTPRARFELPPLAPGLYWLVVSGEPRGAEHLAGAAVSKAILVGDGRTGLGPDTTVNVRDTCSLGPWLAQRPAAGLPRWVALDGLPARSADNRFRHTVGLLIGVLSLLAAGILETLLLVAASREARVSLQLAELDDDDPSATKVTSKPPGGGVVMAVLVAVLGLALLAVLLIAKG